MLREAVRSAIHFSSVDFPTPLGPMRHSTSPGPSSSCTFSGLCRPTRPSSASVTSGVVAPKRFSQLCCSTKGADSASKGVCASTLGLLDGHFVKSNLGFVYSRPFSGPPGSLEMFKRVCGFTSSITSYSSLI